MKTLHSAVPRGAAAMRTMNTKWMKTRLAAFLICALAAQNASFAWADTRGTADRAGRETDAAGGAAGQAA